MPGRRAIVAPSPKGAILGSALSLLLLLAGWLIVSHTLANSFALINPALALFWNPNDSKALVALAEENLSHALAPSNGVPGSSINPTGGGSTNSYLSEAVDFARRALRQNLLASDALTVLARAAEAKGDKGQAITLMTVAGARALRDPIAQAWLLEQNLSRGEFKSALSNLDSLLRTHPDMVDRSLPLLTAFVSFPDASQPLANVLATEPPWRSWFLAAAPAQITSRSALDRFYAELESAPNPPSEEELQPYLDRLVKDGAFEKAYAIWARNLPPRQKPHGDELLYNGNFRYIRTGTEFDWQIQSSLGSEVSVTATAEGAHRLVVEFSGARVEFYNVSHLLLLEPGTYRFSGEEQADDLQTERGLWWHLYCVQGPGQSLGQTELLARSQPWQSFSLTFTVPNTGCQAQILRLELPARIALEQQISGEVAYKALKIERTPGLQNDLGRR